jgi:hypothetical protein
MTVFKFGRGMSLSKFLHQLGEDGRDYSILDICEGVLLASLLIDGPRGVYFLKDTYLNSNSSTYTVYFGRRGSEDENTVNNMWDTFAGADLFSPEEVRAV